MAQIVEILQDYSDLDSIQIVSHGDTAALNLGQQYYLMKILIYIKKTFLK